MRSTALLLLWAISLCVRAGAPVASFTENKGQWPEQVLYRVLLPDGALFIERQAFTYVLQRGGGPHHHKKEHREHVPEPFKAHAFKVHFKDGLAQKWNGGIKAGHYENFFQGSDPSKWGTGCAVFGEVTLHDVWPGIDLHVDGRTGLKYEFIVAPGANPAHVRMVYEGQDTVLLRDERCVVKTTAGDLIEEAPLSYYADDATHALILTRFRLKGDEMTFDLSGEQDPARTLVIDPVLAFASYSGSTGNNFGFTATYDEEGHLYGGGIVFAPGYPYTLGALDGTFNGPLNPPPDQQTVDIGVSKWSMDGGSLIWSTYIGGISSEAPHSMVVNAANELYIFGHTGSHDFPITQGCYQGSFAGGPPVSFSTGAGFPQPNGTDMFVLHLNASATALIGSTFLGGSGNDGLNNDNTLSHNYGDPFRGEIILNAAQEPLIASTTSSTDLPLVNPAQPAYGGGEQDAYCFRLDPTLSNLSWATYLGGTGADAAYGIQVDSQGGIFVAGGTTSADLPLHGTPFRTGYSGISEGFIMRYSSLGAALGSTFLGTTGYDQCYFVQIDTEDDVYVVGQTNGAYPVSAGRYNVPGSSQFIHKLSNDLSASHWSTVFGNGSNVQYLAPTAFLVSNCGQIYFSGWGGAANTYAGILTSTTAGLEVTPGAFQTETDGSDLYLMVLNPDAVSLNHATFFGSPTSEEHVDGGTSRFHKSGTVYQAVCAGCFNDSSFPTTPGAWSMTNRASCNLGVFRFDLSTPTAEIGIDGPNTICIPGTVQFTNSSIGGDTFQWEFGDGASSMEFAPSHVYTTDGVYTVTMRMTDSFGCVIADTADIVVTAIPVPIPTALGPGAICPGTSTQLLASDGLSWSWSPSEWVNDPTLQEPTVTPPGPMSFSVIVESICGFDTATVHVPWITPVGSAGVDVIVCRGSGTALQASGGGTYAWSPPGSLSDPTAASPIASPLDTTAYSVIITTPDGCLVHDTVLAIVYTAPPIPVLRDTVLCIGNSVQLTAPAGATFNWSPAQGLADPFAQRIVVSPTEPTLYMVTVDNGCGSIVDPAFVDVRIPNADAWPDTLVCPGAPVQLFSSPGTSFSWTPTAGLSDPSSPTPIATVHASSTFTLSMVDTSGCIGTASVVLDTHPVLPVVALWEQRIEMGEPAQLLALGDGTFAWAPAATLSDSSSASPIAKPHQTTTYTVLMTDLNGCISTDDVTIIVPGNLFIPNTFTPNGDGDNDLFGAWGVDIVQLRLDVFDRWGKLIWSAPDLAARWDGRYGGQDAPIDTYVWKVRAMDIAGDVHERVGHVTLVR